MPVKQGYGYGAGKSRRKRRAVDIPPDYRAPDPFTASMWDVAPGSDPGTVAVTINELPSDNGSPLTAIKLRSGSDQPLVDVPVALGAHQVAVPGPTGSRSVVIFAVNQVGTSTWSSARIVEIPAEVPTGPSEVTLSAARVGGALNVVNPEPDRAYYVTSRRPGSSTPWTVQTMHDWSATGFTLDERLLGLEFIVRSPNVDPTTKLVTGYKDSDVFGPVLHATDLPAHNGTTVRWCANAAELNAAIDSAACTLAVLQPGTSWTWAGVTLAGKNRLASPLKITTPQDNPAIFTNSTPDWANLKGVTFEGLWLYGTAAWAQSNSSPLISGRYTESVRVIGCKLYGDEIPENVRQDVTGYGTNPTGSIYSPNGFNFMVKSFEMLNGTDLVIDGCTLENVWTAGQIDPAAKIFRHRVRGVYYDNMRLNAQGGVTAVNGGIWDMIVSDCMSLADEMTNLANNQEPHFDVIQLLGGAMEDLTFENIVFCAGDTRASKTVAELNGYNQAEYPLLRTSANHRGTVFRNGLATARGPSGFEMNQSTDGWIDRICSLDFPRSGGGTSITILGGSQGNPSKNEMRVTRSYAGTEIRNAATVADTYLTSDGNVVGLSNVAVLETHLTKAAKPANPIELAQYARPQVDDGTGPLTVKGYMRPVNPLPVRNAATIASLSPGGFRVTQSEVSGASEYGFRYRLATTNPWTTVWQASNVLNVINFAPEVSVEVDWCYRVAADYSRWNKPADRKTVTTAASPPATPPTLTLVPEIGGNPVATTSTTATSTAARNFSHYAADAAPTADEHVALFIFDQTGGAARTPGTPAAMWITQASGAFDPVAELPEIGAFSVTPGASRKHLGGYAGKPPADARGVRLNMGPNSSHTAVAGEALFRASKASTQRQHAQSTQLSTAGECSVTMTVPPATAFAVLAMSNSGAPVLSSPIETLGGNDSTGNATYKWVAGRLYSATGGTITLSATNCRMLEVVAYTG